MTDDRCAQVAGMLTGLRQAVGTTRERAITSVVPEVLLWIASGCDHAVELSEQMGVELRDVKRTLALLQGRKYGGGGNRLIDSPVCLVEHRPHPHRKGKQWVLTTDGKELLRSCKLVTTAMENT